MSAYAYPAHAEIERVARKLCVLSGNPDPEVMVQMGVPYEIRPGIFRFTGEPFPVWRAWWHDAVKALQAVRDISGGG